ncbi:hypothetical protein CRYUN_Cryun02cG0142200 [Craigia yunnanensis]
MAEMETIYQEQQSLQAFDAAAANDWVPRNVVSFSPDAKFRYIAIGNEVSPSDQWAQFVLPAMKNVQNRLRSQQQYPHLCLEHPPLPSDGSFVFWLIRWFI